MRRLTALLLVSLLSGCSVLQGTPEPAPPVTDHPQEIRRNQTEGLQRLGTVSAMVRGSRMMQKTQLKHRPLPQSRLLRHHDD